MNKKEIAICPHCGEPVIFTYLYPQSEYYCLMCGRSYGIFGCERTSITLELKYKKQVYEAVFKAIYKYIVVPRSWKNNCEKCNPMGEYHTEHASDKEKIQDNTVRTMLDKLGSDIYG